MRIATYVWEFTRDYPGAQADDRALPLAAVWVKTHDGATWMGDIAPHPAAPRSSAGVAHLAQVYAAQGIDFLPWCVPTGRDLAGETARAVEVLDGLVAAGAPPRLVLDVEADATAAFWKGTPADLRALVAGIRAAHPQAELVLCHYQYDEIGFAQIADLFAAFTTMDYWTDFGVRPETRLDWSYAHLAGVGRPVTWGLPGDATPADMTRALAWVRDHGGRAVIWRRGTTAAPVWAAVAAFAMPEPPPPPKPGPDPRDTLIGEVRRWVADDAAGAELRRQRIVALLGD
jgi:hypothetical protein